MSAFLWIMCLGLAGLAWMALPGWRHHGQGSFKHPGAAGRFRLGHRTGQGRVLPSGARAGAHGARANLRSRFFEWLPEPRFIFSSMALFGAFGNVLERSAHLSGGLAGVGAMALALALEIAVVRPVWRFALKFQGRPSSPLTGLVLETGEATTAFRNGKGMIQVVHDGRSLQLAARLRPDDRGAVVRIGDRLRIEEVDPERERVIVSVR